MGQKLLLLLEHNGEKLTEPSRRLCENLPAAVGTSDGEFSAVIFGFCRGETLQTLGNFGVKKVYQVSGTAEDFYCPRQRVSNLRLLIAKASPNHILLPSTLWAREMAPLLAFQLQAGFVSECVRINFRAETTEVILNIYQGQYQRVCELTGRLNVILMADCQGGVFEGNRADGPEVVQFSPVEKTQAPVFKVLESFSVPATDLDVDEADLVVGIGRGVETPEDWRLMQELADAVKAPVGGTRPAVDAGWIPFDRQIGQTGQIIAPKLYLAAGISGAQQHISGVEKAKIVAINNDPQAPILRLADLGVVGDFKAIAPLVVQKLRAKEGKH